MKNHAILALVIACLAPAWGGQARPQSPKEGWQLLPRRSLKASKGPYQVVISLVTVRGAGAAALIGWGSDDPDTTLSRPQELIGSLTVMQRGRSVVVPRSAFGDLGNVDRLALTSTKGGLTINIDGGDASTGYHSSLRIIGNKLVSRKVSSGEMPEYDSEETHYTAKAPPG